MESNTEDSAVQGSKYGEIDLISGKVWGKRKGVQEKKLIDKKCEGITNTVAEELASSENIAS